MSSRAQLTAYQREIVDECIAKQSAGLSLPMGAGKTAISLHVAVSLSPSEPIIVICAKTLIANWETEIRKFFGDALPYVVLHRERVRDLSRWTLDPRKRVVITTSEFLSSVYRAYDIAQQFIYRDPNDYVGYSNLYFTPNNPLLSSALVTEGTGTLYTRTWGTLIVDECHNYCNITVDKCRCIASLCATHRWLLSGTHFHEPKVENVLGYYVLLNHPENPAGLSHMQMVMRRRDFKGLRDTLVLRTCAEEHEDARPDYDIVHGLVTVPMSEEEAAVYQMCKDILRTVSEEMQKSQSKEQRRRYAAYLLSMITYLRQILIAPVIVLASVALDACRMEDGSSLSHMIMAQLGHAGLSRWLDSEDALYSSRLRAVVRELRVTTYPRVLIFSAFRTSLRLLSTLIRQEVPEQWKVFELGSEMNLKRKSDVLREFEASTGGVLLLTYKTGSEGLNLQHTNTIFLLDTLWNSSSADQAIARVARRGQIAQEVHVKTFISNTGIEKAVFEKNINKLQISEELFDGPCTTAYHKMKVEQVVRLVLCEENARLYSMIRR